MALKAAPARADKLVLNEGSSSSSEDEEVQEHYSSDEKGELSASSGDEVEAPGKEFDHGVDMDNDEDFEVVSFEERQRKAQELPRRQLTKKIEETKNSHKMALAKPNLVKDRERERHLSRIATKGVVQLFNAVSQRQGEMDKLFADRKGGKREAAKKMDKLKPENFRKKLKRDDEEEDHEIKPDDVDELPDDLKFLVDGSGLGKEYHAKEDVKREDYSD